MAFKVLAFLAATGAALYLLDCLYGVVVRQKARNVGIIRDDRRDNDAR